MRTNTRELDLSDPIQITRKLPSRIATQVRAPTSTMVGIATATRHPTFAAFQAIAMPRKTDKRIGGSRITKAPTAKTKPTRIRHEAG